MDTSITLRSAAEFSQQLINTIQQTIQRVQHDFDAYQNAGFMARSPEFFCLELCGEAGELANLEKKKWKGKSINHKDLEDEAADVLIALCNYSNARGINLAEAVASKLHAIELKRARLEAEGEAY
jgi:NTP pyrophosphatase (non-canonical NTP hydrolase)